jgi:hypothetical protein
MTTKKILRIASFVLLLAIALPANSTTIVPEPVKTEDARTVQLLNRLEEIKAMNISGMTRMEKKDLRKEVREIKKEVKNNGRGIYLSIGAVIIIILLLILIL